MIEFASGQITGRRAAQEDALDVMPLESVGAKPEAARGELTAPLDTGLIMVVADGMGGHVGGRVASTICVQSFLNSIRKSEAGWDKRLEEGLNAANLALRQEVDSRPDLSGMGSTLVGAVVGEQGLGWISIGDSALYHFHNGTLERVNEDHSFGAYLDAQAREGLMTADAAANDRRRNHLFYALLGDDLDHFERFSGFRALVPGDIVMAASDGLKTLSDEEITALLRANADRPLNDIIAALFSAIERVDRDRQDNVSIVLARLNGNTEHQVDKAAPEAASGLPPTAPIQMPSPAPPMRPGIVRFAGIAIVALAALLAVSLAIAHLL